MMESHDDYRELTSESINMNDDALIKEIESVVREYWSLNQSPVLLSNLPPLLESRAPEYRNALVGRSLKAFIASQRDVQFEMLQHPKYRAKIALFPSEQSFDFSSEVESKSSDSRPSRKDQGAVLSFLKALSELPEDDINKVVIPVSVLVKLLGR